MKKVNNLFNAGYGWGRTYPLKTRLKTGLKEEFIDYSKEYMYIEALEDGMTVSFTKKANSGSLYYSLDKQEWNELTEGTPAVNSREKIYFKGDLVPVSYSGIGTFTNNKKCNVIGNTMSLLFADDFVDKTDLTGYDYAFYNLFSNCTNIKSAKNLILPATTLAKSCYGSMFSGCTSLTAAPELPATILKSACYSSMFSCCTGLISAPELPATTLAGKCYTNIFNKCTSLTAAPELPATTLAEKCYQYMFQNCTGLTSAPELPAITLAERCYESMFFECTGLISAQDLLPAITLANYCYSNMFQGCTSLITAPELPAITLAKYCYQYMFNGCSSLAYIKILATDISASSCLNYWVYNVSPTGTFVKAEGVEIPTGTDGIPEGWTVQTA